METKCIKLIGERNLIWENRELKLNDDEVLVKTVQSSICDADLRAFRGLNMPSDLPAFDYIGHEGGGIVAEVGSKVHEFKLGDRVMVFGPHNSFATYFKAHVDNLHLIPESMPMEIGCLGEPMYVGAYGAYEADPCLGDTVAVVGLNFQCLLALQIFKKRGVSKLIAIDYSEKHLELAKKFGADYLINTTKCGAYEEVKKITGNKLCHVVFHSCGYWNPRYQEYWNLSREITKDEGTMASVPDMMSPFTDFSFHRIHHHAINIKLPAAMHHSAAFRKIWVPRMMEMIQNSNLDIMSLITDTYDLNDFFGAMDAFDTNEDHVKIRLICK